MAAESFDERTLCEHLAALGTPWGVRSARRLQAAVHAERGGRAARVNVWFTAQLVNQGPARPQ
eukprot:2517948-Prymnesium_polylepis.1